MRKVRKFVVMIALLVLWGNLAYAENADLSFQMEVLMEDRLVPFTPVPIEVVITNISNDETFVDKRIKSATVRSFKLTIINEEGEKVYHGVSSIGGEANRSKYYGPPSKLRPNEEMSTNLVLSHREPGPTADEIKAFPLFPKLGEYHLVFDYIMVFYKESNGDFNQLQELRKRETLRSEVTVNVALETEYKEAFEAVKNLTRYSRVALISLEDALSLIRSDLGLLQRREGVFPDEEAMEEARVERRKEMHAELAEFLADHGDSPWAPYAWAVEARNTFIEHEDRVLAAEKALAAAEKYTVSHIREDMEDLLEKAREYERRREFAELFWFLGPLKIRADGSGQVMRLRPPREYFRPGGRPILRRHGIVHDVDNIAEYMEEEADLRDVALLVEFEEGAFAEQATFQIGEEENHFLFHAMETGEEEQMILYLQDPDTEEVVPVDSFRLTIKEVDEFWVFASGRGDDRPYDGDYPTEDGRKAEGMRWFGEPSEVSGHPGSLDTEKSNVLVWIHGFNVTENQARESYAQIFRRLYLLGYRGNFVGFTWEGDTSGPLDLPVTGDFLRAIRFDPDQRDAFYTAPSFRNYLIQLWNTFAPENIDVVAHSLGNLVMWESMRLNSAKPIRQVLVRNVVSFQAAIWREAFEEKKSLTYRVDADRYKADTEDDRIPYSVDQQKQQSWRFWFNNPSAHPRDSIAGSFYQSYVSGDSAFFWKRAGDWFYLGRRLFHSWNPFELPFRKWWHYRRDRLENNPSNEYRSPSPEDPRNFHNRLPALLNNRQWRSLPTHIYKYTWNDLNDPIGAVVNPVVNQENNFNAAENTGWRIDEHSDYLAVDSDMWFPKIYSWWDLFLGEGITVEDKNGLNIIPIGEE